MKEGMLEHWRSKAAHALAPELVIWECDAIVYRAGWLQQGIVGPAQLGTAGYLHETPEKRILTDVLEPDLGRPARRSDRARARDRSRPRSSRRSAHWFTRYPGRPDYFTPLG